jgi:4-amino-4-deoxy-L-arabinose transferase-like glycosyltransferase
MRQWISQSARASFERASAWVHALVLLFLCGILYFPYLNSVPFFDKGEPREALAVQDIVQRGEWLVPLKRATDIPSKPPLMHWSAALVTKITGTLDEATIRFPSALYATLGVLLVYWLGRQIFDARTALLGAVILATTMIYQDQALSARVDMTLCFAVTANLALFYALYSGYLKSRLWFYLFYIGVGVGTLAKGPLGMLLVALVAGSLALVERRWDMIRKFCFHPGVILMIALGTSWYVIAVVRGGEGFFDRQILEENLSRFVGGSGHSHPIYYYIPYLFAQSMPWGIFLPFLLWDFFRTGLREHGGALFLKVSFVVMFVFFSVSVGKRPVYLLPIYPALSLLFACWFHRATEPGGGRLAAYRVVALFTGLTGALLLVIALGALWSHDPGWILNPIQGMLKPKDRSNLIAIQRELAHLDGSFTLLSLLAAALWLLLTRSLWLGKMRSVGYHMVGVSLLQCVIAWTVIMPIIAESKSYRDFMMEVNRRVRPEDTLYRMGTFNTDALVFYRGGVMEPVDRAPEALAGRIGRGNAYLILSEQDWKKIQTKVGALPSPLATSTGRGPEGDARLVLVRAGLP